MWLRTITTWLPLTKAIEALRGILLKGRRMLSHPQKQFFSSYQGWNFEHMIVQQAFLVTFIWAAFFFLATLLIFNCRRL